eukprot:1991908-Prymnesium_polylepis.1
MMWSRTPRAPPVARTYRPLARPGGARRLWHSRLRCPLGLCRRSRSDRTRQQQHHTPPRLRRLCGDGYTRASTFRSEYTIPAPGPSSAPRENNHQCRIRDPCPPRPSPVREP